MPFILFKPLFCLNLEVTPPSLEMAPTEVKRSFLVLSFTEDTPPSLELMGTCLTWTDLHRGHTPFTGNDSVPYHRVILSETTLFFGLKATEATPPSLEPTDRYHTSITWTSGHKSHTTFIVTDLPKDHSNFIWNNGYWGNSSASGTVCHKGQSSFRLTGSQATPPLIRLFFTHQLIIRFYIGHYSVATGATPPFLGLMVTVITRPSLWLKDKQDMLPSLGLMNTETMSCCLGQTSTEATQYSL